MVATFRVVNSTRAAAVVADASTSIRRQLDLKPFKGNKWDGRLERLEEDKEEEEEGIQGTIDKFPRRISWPACRYLKACASGDSKKLFRCYGNRELH